MHPKSGDTILASDMRQHLDSLADIGDRWVTGYDISTSTDSLDVNIQGGIAVVNGSQIGQSGDSTVTKTLTADSTNHIFLKDDANLEINTGGTQPDDSIKLYEIVTDGSGVPNEDVDNNNPGSGSDDFRDDTVTIDAPVEGHRLDLTANNKTMTGGRIELSLNEPYIKFTDTSDDTTTTIRAQNGKLRLLDGDGSTLRDDLRTSGTSDATADTLVKRDGSGEASFTTISLTNLNSGSIPFAAAGSDRLIQDTNLHWDDNDDELGILTDSPDSTVHVDGGDLHIKGPDDTSITHTIEQGANTGSSGTPSFNIDLLGSAGASNPVLRINDDGALEWGPGGATALDTKLERGAADRLDLASGDSFRIVSGSLEFGSSGDVALNRNTSDRLTLATGDDFRISASGELQFGTDVALSRGTTDRLDLASGDSMSIGGSLRVGGTGTPSDTLDVDGTANINGATTIGGNLTANGDFTADGTTHTLEGPDDASGTVVVQPGADTATAGTPDVNLDLRTARGDSNPTVRVDPDNARIEFGPGGSSGTDTNLYRGGTDTLTTDDSVVVGGSSLNMSNSGNIQDAGTDAIQFDGSQNVTIPNGDLTASNALTVSGASTLTGGLDVDGDVTGDASGTPVTIWDESNRHIPTGSLESDAVTVSAGSGLGGGGSVSLGGSTTLSVNVTNGIRVQNDNLEVTAGTHLSQTSSGLTHDDAGLDGSPAVNTGSGEVISSLDATNGHIDGAQTKNIDSRYVQEGQSNSISSGMVQSGVRPAVLSGTTADAITDSGESYTPNGFMDAAVTPPVIGTGDTLAETQEIAFVVPVSGTVRDLRVAGDTDAMGSGNSITIELQRVEHSNGSIDSFTTLLSVTFDGGNSSYNHQKIDNNSTDVSAGDYLIIRVSSSSNGNLENGIWSFLFET